MPITVVETRRSRRKISSGSPEAFREYQAWGDEDPDAIETAVLAAAPATVNGLVQNQIDTEPDEDDETQFVTRIRYALRKKTQIPAVSTSEFNFEISTQTAHITRSLETISSYGTSPPDFQGGINWDGETFQGVDVMIANYSFSETHYLPIANVTEAYKLAISAAAGKVCNHVFRGLAVGEVLFIGATGNQRDEDSFAINYRFAHSPNATGLAIGSLTGINKLGWEYLWVSYKDIEDATAKVIIKQPEFAYVERVYEFANFAALLGI